VTPTEEIRACQSFPCHMSSTCIDLPGATYTCNCLENYTGFHCDEEINLRVYEASFDGKSYVRMNRLKAYYKLSIEVEFKTYAENGIIMYNQQKQDGTGDFVSLAIVDGWVTGLLSAPFPPLPRPANFPFYFTLRRDSIDAVFSTIRTYSQPLLNFFNLARCTRCLLTFPSSLGNF
jgi:hypothetical protein